MEQEITVVGFAGGGGSCEGIKMALGHSPVVALNHDAVAVGMHGANHPDSIHYCQNIWKAVPGEVLREVRVRRKLNRRPKIGLAWFSPDCKHFSKAKGGKPVEKNIRDLGWVVLAWAKLPRSQRPRVLIVENVEEYVDWGPLKDCMPDPDRKGETFKKWDRSFQREGYRTEYREIVAADYGSPTTRKRLFWIARNDGLPIVWPETSHGKPESPAVISGRKAPWRIAAEIIDWSIPCPSIFETSAEIKRKHGIRAIRPLADNTMARIARGVFRYVIDCAEPFIVPITHTGDARVHGLREPLRTVTTAHRGEHALITPFLAPRYLEKEGHGPRVRSVSEPAATITGRGNAPGMLIAPTLINTRNGERPGQDPRCRGPREPWTTVTAGGSQGAVVAAFLAKHYGDTGQRPGSDMREPVSTITASDHNAVVSAGLVNLKGSDRRWSAIQEPTPTQCAGGWHIAEVRAFLTKFHGLGGQHQTCTEPLHTADCKARFGLITAMISGEPYAIVDIGMRMLTPRELFRAQGFPDSYCIDRQADGRPITKTDQIRMVGNSVCPQVAAALVRANYDELEVSIDGIPEFALQAAE